MAVNRRNLNPVCLPSSTTPASQAPGTRFERVPTQDPESRGILPVKLPGNKGGGGIKPPFPDYFDNRDQRLKLDA